MKRRVMPPGMPYLLRVDTGARLVTPFWMYDMKTDPVTGALGFVPRPTPLGERLRAPFAPARDAVIDGTVRVVYWSLVGFLFVASALTYIAHRSHR